MKKLFVLALTMCLVMGAQAQLMDAKTMLKLANETYGKNLLVGAAELQDEYPLTAKGMSMTKEMDVPGMTKDELYTLVRENLVGSIGYDGIVYEDKESGIIDEIIPCGVVGEYKKKSTAWSILYSPSLRYKLSDEHIKVTYTNVGYRTIQLEKEKKSGGIMGKVSRVAAGAGVMGVAGGALGGSLKAVQAGTKVLAVGAAAEGADIIAGAFTEGSSTTPSVSLVDWQVENCYPYNTEDEHSDISAQLLCMGAVYGQAVLDRVEDLINRSCQEE